ncbi:sulfatase [Parabacteroides sp. PF5-6]|uniref:sulfatase family protein n=1 Tax=Parabacteroides sp. PF5-6 TaxID=1742403 RepID=UPI00240582A6|nr:sulfatase [Parabacteroides sp. PF5-6]MDF9831658.1 arylsulfatase A-like enzyme [Parabacteroides sp. PF5-6]
MNRKHVLLPVLGSIALGALAADHTNFIVIYLDDMGYGDLSITGATGYQTPNIDRMASEGMFFTHYYSPQAVSSASRCGLMTGCYPNRIGFAGAIDHSSTYGLSNKEETIGTVLKKKNYKTAAFGKWHLGCVPEYMPLQNGFDEFFGIPYSHDMWPNHPTTKNYYPPLPLYEGEKVIETMPDHNLFTARFTERAVQFIEQNQENPFFLYLPHPLPHVPLGVSDRFKGKSEEGMYGDVMMEIDWSVGQILQAVDKAGLAENTLIIFTSDNGPWINYGNHAGSTGGLREGKGTTYEGGQRVPCLMRWKGTIPEGIACNKLIAGMDILPTLAAIAEAPLPEKRIDGVSVLPLMMGDMEATPRESFYFYYRKNNLEAVTNGEWKLVFAHPGRTYEGFSPGNDGRPGGANENFNHEGGLYDLRRDPGERYNVKFANPTVVKELEKIAEEARRDLGDDLTGNPGSNRRLAY